jgi:hypothetical protein
LEYCVSQQYKCQVNGLSIFLDAQKYLFLVAFIVYSAVCMVFEVHHEMCCCSFDFFTEFCPAISHFSVRAKSSILETCCIIIDVAIAQEQFSEFGQKA